MPRRYLFSPKYHLTPLHNVSDIERNGLLIAKDARQQGRIWLCDHHAIKDVAYHLLSVKKLSYCHFLIYSVRWWLLQTHLCKHSTVGRYYVRCDIPRNLIEPVSRFIADTFSVPDEPPPA